MTYDLDQRKQLHGKDYVAAYQQKSPTRLRKLIDRMEIPSGVDLVDFGCGDAVVIDYLKNLVGSYKGIDFSEDFIAVANQRKEALGLTNVEFECASIVEASKRHLEAFDIGVSLDLSEHVYDGEWQDIIKAMYQCLRPGGTFYQHTPNATFVVEKMKDNGFILKQFPEHIAVRNAEANKLFLSKAGFVDIKVSYLPHYNILRALHPLSFLPGVGMYFQARLLISARKPLV